MIKNKKTQEASKWKQIANRKRNKKLKERKKRRESTKNQASTNTKKEINQKRIQITLKQRLKIAREIGNWELFELIDEKITKKKEGKRPAIKRERKEKIDPFGNFKKEQKLIKKEAIIQSKEDKALAKEWAQIQKEVTKTGIPRYTEKTECMFYPKNGKPKNFKRPTKRILKQREKMIQEFRPKDHKSRLIKPVDLSTSGDIVKLIKEREEIIGKYMKLLSKWGYTHVSINNQSEIYEEKIEKIQKEINQITNKRKIAA